MTKINKNIKNSLVEFIKTYYNGIILFIEEICRKGGHKMSSYDLIWLLIEMLLKEKKTKLKDQSQKED